MLAARQLESAFSVVQWVLPLKNVSSTRSCVGLDMCYVCRHEETGPYRAGSFERLTWNPAESLVCDVLRQLNVLHQAASCFSRNDIPDVVIHVYICNVLLIRLLKIRRQPTTGFALFGAHQV
ncbi:hypothetical protein T265_05457 [Opisthorchis viverrini]|uniref:Uncharacterized protein n=1 Tax=Opisthorchis viverrini TaxID=6198 RepID=A0A074ZKB9_OPIVI|nr:hypothetical protein T265_05457 [Opisthorchis viverrini]KER27496.1 hypothetical protein T265_05457 [Opisthorchis viverrini]